MCSLASLEEQFSHKLGDGKTGKLKSSTTAGPRYLVKGELKERWATKTAMAAGQRLRLELPKVAAAPGTIQNLWCIHELDALVKEGP